MLIFILLLWLGFAVGVGILASRYQRSGFGWFVLAMIISPLLSGILILALGPSGKKCPNCGETVKKEARTCRYCNHSFGTPSA